MLKRLEVMGLNVEIHGREQQLLHVLSYAASGHGAQVLELLAE